MIRPRQSTTRAPETGDQALSSELSATDLQVLSELGGAFGSDRDLNDALSWLDEQIKPMLMHDRFVVDLLSADYKSIMTIYTSGVGRPKLMPGESDPIDGSIAGYVAASGDSFLDSSVGKSLLSRFPGVEHTITEGIRSWIAVPLRSNGISFGSATFLAYIDGHFSDRSLQLAEIVAGYIANAINKDRLLTQLKAESTSLHQDRVREAALKQIGLTISASLHMRDVFEDFSEVVKLLIPSEYISVISIRDDESVIRDSFVAGNFNRRDPVDIETSISGHVARERSSFLANLNNQKEIDALLDQFPPVEFDVNLGFRSFLTVPLFAENKCIGAIHFRDSVAGTLGSEHVEIAEQIATIVSPAVVNAGLHLDIQKNMNSKRRLRRCRGS